MNSRRRSARGPLRRDELVDRYEGVFNRFKSDEATRRGPRTMIPGARVRHQGFGAGVVLGVLARGRVSGARVDFGYMVDWVPEDGVGVGRRFALAAARKGTRLGMSPKHWKPLGTLTEERSWRAPSGAGAQARPGAPRERPGPERGHKGRRGAAEEEPLVARLDGSPLASSSAGRTVPGRRIC